MKGLINKVLLSMMAVQILMGISYGDVQTQPYKQKISSEKTSTANISSKSTKFSGSWRIRLGAEKLNDEISQGTATNLSGSMKLNYQLVDNLFLYLLFSFVFYPLQYFLFR